MTASLPQDVQSVFDRFITTEFTTIDSAGQPITWPLTPYYRPGDPHISVTTGLGYPKKANDARANERVSMLFSDPTGSGVDGAPMVLVQGIADVDERDLEANSDRYQREAVEKMPDTADKLPPKPIRRTMQWYFARIYINVRPERVFVWRGGHDSEPEIFDSHMEEVRSGRDEEPDVPHAAPAGKAGIWNERIAQLGDVYETAVLSLISPDGFPFSIRVPVAADEAAGRVRILAEPEGVPLQPGLACVAGHRHEEGLQWQQNFQVRGDLVEDDQGWALIPSKTVGGFEIPPGGPIAVIKENFRKIMRFRKIAKQEMKRREERLRQAGA